jgi:membrane protein implicated in regulation of membrane protease activity
VTYNISGYEELVAKMKEVARKSLRYNKLVALLSGLTITLIVSSATATVVYVLSNGVYWQLLVASIALAIAVPVANRLSDRYYREAIKETKQLERLVYILALSIKIDGLIAKLEKEIDELEREMKKRGIRATG